ncbi:hypothetical protein SK128_007200 [Halocaridina rubra]|uniref:REJ domain-containing protein n=1 Tax=Halocaridina rubra TaxID=373956 RepID=A0AAN8WFQ1_HALRR
MMMYSSGGKCIISDSPLLSLIKDPDAIDQKNLTKWRFVWICYREGEANPHPDHASLIEVPLQPVNITALTDRGGCFGSGPGRLNLTENTSSVTLNSRNSVLHSVLVFAIHVTTPTKRKVAYQRIEITRGDPPEIIIRCISNCQVKVNPNDTYSVLGRCFTCDALGVTLTYNWTLYARNESTEDFYEVKEFQKMAPHTGTTGRSINIKEGELAPGRCYRIQLTGFSPYTATTYTQLDFCTTRPPFGGFCSVSPAVGIVLETGFTVSCDNWINPETETSAGLKYQVWSQVQGLEDPPVLLSASPNPWVENLIFGPGVEAYNFTHLVSIIISHELGAYTNVYTSLKVEPPKLNAEELTSFMHSASEDLMGLMSSGDSQKGFQQASAMGSMLNSVETAPGNSTDEEEVASAKQQEEERKALRDTLINAIGSSKVYTLDAIQQSAGAIATVTKKPSEVSPDSQMNTVGFMSDMANTLTSFTVGKKGEPPSMKTTVAAATGLIASVANAGKAAADTYHKAVTVARDLLVATNISDFNDTDAFEWFTTTTAFPTTQSVATTTLLATTAAMLESSSNLVT